MKIIKKISAAVMTAMLSLCCTVNAAAISPDTGNTEQSTYIWIVVVAGVLVVAAVVAGFFTKKKK